VSQSLSELHALMHEGWQVPCPPESTAPELESELSLGLSPGLALPPSLDPLSRRLPDPESLSTDASVPPSRNIGPTLASVDPPHAIATSDSKATAGTTARRMVDDAPVMGATGCLGAMRPSLAPSGPSSRRDRLSAAAIKFWTGPAAAADHTGSDRAYECPQR
jgi:hypothetical protein